MIRIEYWNSLRFLQCSLFYTVLMQGVLAEATEGVEILGPAQWTQDLGHGRIDAGGRWHQSFIGSSNSKVCKWKWLDLWLRTQHTLWTTDSWKETAEMITFSHLILRNCPRSFCNPMPSRYLFPSTVKSSSQSHSSISECIWVSYISCLEPNRVHMFPFEGNTEIEGIFSKILLGTQECLATSCWGAIFASNSWYFWGQLGS